MMGLLQRTGNLWFSIAGAGKEAINVAISSHLRPDDAKLPYYRDQAMAQVIASALREGSTFQGADDGDQRGVHDRQAHHGRRHEKDEEDV